MEKELQDILSIRVFTRDMEIENTTEEYIIDEKTDEVLGLLYQEKDNNNFTTFYILATYWNNEFRLEVTDHNTDKTASYIFKSVHDMNDFLSDKMNFDFEMLDLFILGKKFMENKLETYDFDKLYNVFLEIHDVDKTIQRLIYEHLTDFQLQEFVIKDLLETLPIKELRDKFYIETKFNL